MQKLKCHCGEVEAEINISDKLDKFIRCNCSICKRKGAIMSMVKNEDFKIIIKGLETEDERRKHIYENICIIESTDYVDACPYKSNKYEPDNALYSENVGHSEYMDYQLPVLNRQGVDDNIFKKHALGFVSQETDSIR